MQIVRKLVGLTLIMTILAGCVSNQPASPSPTLAPAIIASPTAAPSTTPSEISPPHIQNTPAATTQAAITEPPVVNFTEPLVATPTVMILPGPDCAVGLPPTRPDMEGPYFLAGSSEKGTLIEPGMSGTPLTISGYVLTEDCKWIPDTKLEFWQADSNGVYDLKGYRLRGHVFTDENGRYKIQTIIPAPYEPRPRHIHVMVLPPGMPGLTTQLYFPSDSPYPELTLKLIQDAQGATAEFNFVMAR
jgi:protocatechuate 3,4-dioxygenase beta subunit